MADSVVILIENKIPFINGRLEEFADVKYLSAEEFTPDNVRNADALIVRTRTRCDAKLLAGSKVRFIATATIGTDHIDTEWCEANSITVANAPGCNAPAVAQYVWASIIHRGLKPRDISIGVVGCGNVGSIVAEWGECMGATVLRCDPPLVQKGRKGFLTLEEILPQCNVVTIHTPLTHSGPHPTYHLIDSHRLAMMTKGCLLINAARGEVIDTAATIAKARAAEITPIIDCWEGEPNINQELLDLAYIATPHIAGYSLEGKQRATRMVVQSTAAYFGFPISSESLNDLTDTYEAKSSITAEQIAATYCPMTDCEELRRAMAITGNISGEESCKLRAAHFEQLRSTYKYRNEA